MKKDNYLSSSNITQKHGNTRVKDYTDSPLFIWQCIHQDTHLFMPIVGLRFSLSCHTYRSSAKPLACSGRCIKEFALPFIPLNKLSWGLRLHVFLAAREKMWWRRTFHGCILQLLAAAVHQPKIQRCQNKKDAAPTRCLSVAFTSSTSVCGFLSLFFPWMDSRRCPQSSQIQAH